MTGNFGARAVQLYGLAARELGWRPDDFWPATPRECVDALIPSALATSEGIDREQLGKMMDQDHARR